MSTLPADLVLEDVPVAVSAGLTPRQVAKKKPKTWLFWVAITVLLAPGLVHAYLLMPFPGSQNLEAITVSYYLEKLIWPLRTIGALLVAVYAINFFAESTPRKIIHIFVILLGLISFYYTDVAYSAASMFKEPESPKFANIFTNKVAQDMVVIGVVHNGEAKAYPIVYLGYHHKVQDNVGNLPVLVTYCTMCRTGRVFSPMIDGKQETFRLVGARHYNAVIEDASTKTWWYQATGEAAVGKRQGQKLTELPYEQATLSAWLKKYPRSLVMQPQQQFKADYADLNKYDITQPLDRDSTIVNKDTLVRKSWVIGVTINGQSKAYDWRRMVKAKVINDMVNQTPLLVSINNDEQTFHAFNRSIAGHTLHFKWTNKDTVTDLETKSLWNNNGLCVSGRYQGSQLTAIQAYQEYWHSWKNFHSGTTYAASFGK